MNGIDDFINPKSMLTPGITGGVIMFITNSFCCQFSIEPRWVGLFLSFLFGLLVLKAETIPRWERGVYYVLNSLVIFSVAFGTAQLGTEIEPKSKLTHKAGLIQEYQPSFAKLPVNHMLAAEHPDMHLRPAVLEMTPDLQRYLIKVQTGVTPEKGQKQQSKESLQPQESGPKKSGQQQDHPQDTKKKGTKAGPSDEGKKGDTRFFKKW